MQPAFAVVLLVSSTAVSFAAPAAEHWSATSRTATAITGDIDLSSTKLLAAGRTFPLAIAADVEAFGTSGGPKDSNARVVRRHLAPPCLGGDGRKRPPYAVIFDRPPDHEGS